MIVRDAADSRIHFEGCVWAQDPRPTNYEDVEDAASGSWARCCFPDHDEADDDE